MNNHAWWANAIKNSVAIIAFTLLAIHFDKWWIVLFSLFFISSISYKK